MGPCEPAMKLRMKSAAVLIAASLTGCLYADVRTPLAYRSPTPADVGGNLGQEVSGKACNHLILWLIAFGDGGYEAAVKDAKESSGTQLVADVKADTSLLNVLSLYQRQCTTVRARAVTASSAPGPAAAPAAGPPAPPGGG